jgi:glycosyltransferase involved in cell wall biosynthesis
MKIAFIVAGGFDRSGRERVAPVLLWLVGELARRHDVHVFVLDYYPEPASYELVGAAVHDLGRPRGVPGTRRLAIPRRLAAALAANGPFDVLHAYQGMPAGWAAACVANAVAAPLVVTLDSGELVRHDDIAYGLQRRFVDRRAVAKLLRTARTLTVSTAFMQEIAVRFGVHPIVVPMGVDASAFPRADRADGPPWRLIRVASLNRVKDYPTLLNALATLAAQRPDVHLDIVGEDTLGGETRSLADRLGVASRVTFHGALPTERVAGLYSAAHVNVVSSRHEAACVSVLEAAATGLPTVGTAVGYVADWMPALAVGVPVGDPVALSKAIANLLADKPRRDAIAARARAWALAHDSEWTAQQFERIYRDAVTQR